MLVFIDLSLGLWFFMVLLTILGFLFDMSITFWSTRILKEAQEENSDKAGSMAMMINYIEYALRLAVLL